MLVLSEIKLVSPLLCLWVRIWGCATSCKYEEPLWCANEDVFTVDIHSYHAFVLLLPSLVCLLLPLRLFYCSLGIHLSWHAEREKQQSLKTHLTNIHYVLNNPFNNERKKKSPSLLQLHSFKILIPKAALSYPLYLHVCCQGCASHGWQIDLSNSRWGWMRLLGFLLELGG